MKKKKQSSKITLHAYKLRFELEKIPDQPGWSKNGVATIHYEKRVDGGEASDIQVRLPIISIWRDPSTGNAAKAHLAIIFRNLQNRKFLEEALACGIVQCPDNMEIVASPEGVMRYSHRRAEPFRCKADSSNNWKEEAIYDSKAIAMNAIIREAQMHKTVAGLQLITMDAVPDSVLVEAGFERVPDIMRRSVDMWKGAARDVFSVGDWREQDKNVVSFLTVLDKALKGQ